MIFVKILPTPKPRAGVDAGISHGAELAGSIVVFFAIGFGLDAWLGTTPVFMICLTVFSVVGQFVKTYYVYNRAMSQLEARRMDEARGAGR